jgi:hypothetical protein
MIEEANLQGHNTAPNLQGNNKALSGHKSQGAEAAGASEEDTGISLEGYIAYSVVKTRATPQEHAKSQFRSKRRLLKLRRGRINRSRSYIMLLSLCTRIRRQSTTYGFCRFSKSLSSFLGPSPITTTITTYSDSKPAARRAPTRTTTT